MDHSKRKNIYIIVFVVTTIIAACVAVYFGIKVNESKGDLQIANKDIEEYKAKLEQATVNKGEVTTPSTDKKDCEEKGSENVKRVVPDWNKGIIVYNKNSEYYLTPSTYDNSLYSQIEKDGKVTFTLSDSFTFGMGSTPEIPVKRGFPIEVTGLGGKVVDTLVAIHGQVSEGTMVLYLMEDGTVEYLNFEKMLKTGKCESAGKIPELSDIIQLRSVKVGGNGGGLLSAIAVRDDGSFYDIGQLLVKYNSYYAK